MISRVTACVGALICLLTSPEAVIGQTLADMVRANGGKPVTITGTIDAPTVSVPDLPKYCDLIIVGSLTKKGSYVGKEQIFVYTDYALNPERVLLNRSKAPATSAAPAQTAPLTITLYGGTVEVDGVPVTVRDGSQPASLEGKRLLLFLTRNTEKPNNYFVYGNAGGIFEVGANGRLKSVSTEQGNAELDNMSVDELAQRLAKR